MPDRPQLLDRLKTVLADRYRIERELGAGGMATVYLARDLKHERKVALKVLRPELAAVIGADRFLAEIKTTANLQHPHILPLFDSGQVDSFLFYVMPYVEGESLRDRLTRETQLSIADAVQIASEVASALDYAHRAGVIHRDIKPENILLHDGRVLVADFGIALAVSSAGGTRLTETGMSLGTPHYMSPEQAMGEREITARSDVYALGCVLYEMLLGEPPFTGPSAQAIVAQVVTAQPRPLRPQRHTVPAPVEAAVLTALEKLPADRFATAAEFAEVLEGRRQIAAAAGPVGSTGRRRATWWIPWGIAALALAVAGISLRSAPDREPVRRFEIAFPPSYFLFAYDSPAISPDGRYLVYSAQARLYLREQSALDGEPMPGTENAWAPFFSPDGRTIAFVTGLPGALRMTPVVGGSPVTLVKDSVYGYGGSWSDDGWIYYVGAGSNGLMRIRPEGGTPETIVRPDPAKDELQFLRPDVLPGGRVALLTVWRQNGAADVAAIDLDTREMRVLTGGVRAIYATDGRILVATGDGSLFAAELDTKRLALRTAPARLNGKVRIGQAIAPVTVSRTGTLVYEDVTPGLEVVRAARDGSVTPVDPSWEGEFGPLTLSPDGRRLAVSVLVSGGWEVWVKALDTGPFTRLASGGLTNYRPAWSPDGSTIYFASDRTGRSQLYRIPADGSAQPVRVGAFAKPVDEVQASADGRWLIVRVGSGGGRDVYGIRTGNDSTPVPLLTGVEEEYSPALSPDGRWLTYASDASGQSEVYVRPFPNTAAARMQVSRGGGLEPAWSRSGRELFYRNTRGDLIAMGVIPGSTFRTGPQRVLVRSEDYLTDDRNRSYAIALDDQSFFFIRPRTGLRTRMVVVLNWFDELRAVVGR